MAQEKKLKRDTGYNQSRREFQVISNTVTRAFPRHTYSKMASDSENTTITMEDVVSSLKTFESPELFKLLKAIATEAEKKSKATAKGGAGAKATSAKKAGSMPKGAVPPQLKKPRAWVEFTLKNALENGWESFTVLQKKKDKDTNTVTEEQIEMPASVLHNGAHIYEGSVSDSHPDGRQIIHKEAMSLSKQRKESAHATYAEFEASYVDETTDDDKSDAGSTASKKIVVKKTAAEKEAEAAAKKAEKEAAKAAAKAEKDAAKAAAKAEKDAEKAAAKAAKDAEKAAAKAAKDADKKPVVKAPVPAAAVKKAATKPAAPAAAPAPVEAKPVAPKKKPAAKVDEIPNDGMVHPCTIKGKKYLRNFDGETWTVGADGGVGEWAGLYNATSNTLDASAPEPVFEDDE